MTRDVVSRQETVLYRYRPGPIGGESLSELADRPDCYYVKYSIEPRDGMYLGRCFLLHDQEVGTLWREYKKHPRMMCNVQDDDFTLPFRQIPKQP